LRGGATDLVILTGVLERKKKGVKESCEEMGCAGTFPVRTGGFSSPENRNWEKISCKEVTA